MSESGRGDAYERLAVGAGLTGGAWYTRDMTSRHVKDEADRAREKRSWAKNKVIPRLYDEIKADKSGGKALTGFMGSRAQYAVGVPLLVSGARRLNRRDEKKDKRLSIRDDVAKPLLGYVGLSKSQRPIAGLHDSIAEGYDVVTNHLGEEGSKFADSLAQGAVVVGAGGLGEKLAGASRLPRGAGFVTGAATGALGYGPVRNKIEDRRERRAREERRKEREAKRLARERVGKAEKMSDADIAFERSYERRKKRINDRKDRHRVMNYAAATAGLGSVGLLVAPSALRTAKKAVRVPPRVMEATDKAKDYAVPTGVASSGLYGLATFYGSKTTGMDTDLDNEVLRHKAQSLSKGFVDEYRVRLSPSAQERHRHMSHRRNVERASSIALGLGVTPLLGRQAWKQSKRALAGGKAVSPSDSYKAVGLQLGTAGSGYLAYEHHKIANGYGRSVRGIEDRARQRERDGIVVDQVTGRKRKEEVEKALVRVPKPRSRPVRFGGVRSGGVYRVRNRVFTRRWSPG